MAGQKGFIVSSWASGGRVLATGRLEDSRSFALACRSEGGAVLVPAEYADTAATILARFGARRDGEAWTDLAGRPQTRFRLPGGARPAVERALLEGGVPLPLLDRGGADEFLASRGIASALSIAGSERRGDRVDAVFVDPALEAADCLPPLRWLALDIETDREERVLAVSLIARAFGAPSTESRESADGDAIATTSRSAGEGEVLFLGPELGLPWVSCHADEGSLLEALAARIVALDADIVTGWNVIEFDLAVLEARYAALGLGFAVGRSRDRAGWIERPGKRRVFDLPGRAVVDGIRLFRSAGERFEDQSLETVAQAVLGEGKTVTAGGEDKLAELERLRAEEPALFCEYCLRDSELVLRLLEKTGLARLTQKRAALTGLSIDLAWTSIPAFERVYDAALRARRVVPPGREPRNLSGAAGGTVLDPRAGLFEGVLVFDFRSLYPSLMRTFNIDPLAHARSEGAADPVMAPNGARFSREPGILPAVIARYSAEREQALAAGDDTGAYVYKILQNSFYGVLGSEGCRYARTELAGAITSFARKYLTFARDFFEARGYRVLYGDTDSVFVESGRGAGSGHGEMTQLGEKLAAELNAAITASVLAEYGLVSFMRIRCEKVYARFFIPRLRFEGAGGGTARGAILARGEGGEEGEGEGRGRAKGYAGLLLAEDGSASVEVKGMEAARSDGTPLGRRFQVELLALVFGASRQRHEAAAAGEVEAWCRALAASLRRGELDGELVYRRMLRRAVSEYGAENPAVRAARILGWTTRRGRISWVMTKSGAEPPEKRSDSPLDYEHYVEHQLLPMAKAIGDEAGWNPLPWLADRPQMELGF